MIAFFKTFVYIPLYNILILILNIDWIDAGIATIILTVLVKFLLYPISKKATITQIKMSEKEPELNQIKEKYKNNQEQAIKVMEFYKTNKINPFSGILAMFIQIPIIISLYYIFLKSGLPNVDTNLLYSFIGIPDQISMNFLGFFDISKQSVFLAILAAVSSFVQMHLAPTSSSLDQKNESFSKIMAKQMKFTMPFIVFFISWKISGVVALYWFVSNVTGIIQDYYIKKHTNSIH